MSASRVTVKPAPLLGEHNEEVYIKKLGISAGELERLQREGVCLAYQKSRLKTVARRCLNLKMAISTTAGAICGCFFIKTFMFNRYFQ
ncbi:MAG: hypothetical protein ACOX1J_02430 [Dethiobacteria bacterium]|jgi:hypothetical protein